MRVTALETDGERRLILEAPDGASAPLPGGDLAELLRGSPDPESLVAAAAQDLRRGSRPTGRVVSPVVQPSKQLYVGVNYHEHVKELPPPWKMTEDPFVFAKLPSSIIGPDEPIRLPFPGAKLDYEVELLVVIGRKARNLTPENALDHVFGYTITNDVTEREVQATDNQLTMGKGFDTFCPIGPSVVLRDEIPDPGVLDIWTRVNGQERQRSSTSDMIFSVPELLVSLTRYVTLEPGDTVSTGTPAGVGGFRVPPVYLAPGDVVTVGIDVIGELTNHVVAPDQPGRLA
jgi:2-keto-4-pentenoate hydratase/2-oxohepta-3-ene-1,7-dioic acid hydratase in catechol pathway